MGLESASLGRSARSTHAEPRLHPGGRTPRGERQYQRGARTNGRPTWSGTTLTAENFLMKAGTVRRCSQRAQFSTPVPKMRSRPQPRRSGRAAGSAAGPRRGCSGRWRARALPLVERRHQGTRCAVSSSGLPLRPRAALRAAWPRARRRRRPRARRRRALAGALARLRQDVDRAGAALALVPEPFTARELREVHEAIHGRALDVANFDRRLRRLIEDGYVDVVPETRATGRRPARLFRAVPADVRAARAGARSSGRRGRSGRPA